MEKERKRKRERKTKERRKKKKQTKKHRMKHGEWNKERNKETNEQKRISWRERGIKENKEEAFVLLWISFFLTFFYLVSGYM